jgi:hypothetical protein
MNDGGVGVVLAIVGLLFGLFAGLRWARMQHARSGWASARGDHAKAKAKRTEARGKFWTAWRAAMVFGIAAAAYVYAIVRGAR